MGAMPVTMDGRDYHVFVVYNTLARSFNLVEGENADYMLSGRYERDLVGSEYSYEMGIAPDPSNRGDYDDFFYAISAPVDTHEITMPFGQGAITFDARVLSGQDVYEGTLAGSRRWSGLAVQFIPISPQRSVES